MAIVPAPLVGDACSELFKPVEDRPHRPLVGLLVPVEADGTVGVQDKAGYETHDCAGEPAIHGGSAVEPSALRRGDGDGGLVIIVRRAVYAERVQRFHHEFGVS